MSTLAREANDSSIPKIDPRIFWINVRYKLVIPVLLGCLIALLTHYVLKTVITTKWEASTYVIRHGKNMSRQANIPYLYLQTNMSTVVETILLRDNLEHVINNLQLETKPEDLRKAIEVTKGNKSNVIRISATAQSQALSVKIADSLSDIFLTNYASVQNAAARKVHTYYENKLKMSKEQLYSERFIQRQFKEKHNIIDFSAQKDNIYKAIAELELRHMEENIHISDLQSRLSSINEKLSSTGNTTLISEVVRTNENTLTQKLKSELQVLRKRYTDQNPKIQHLLHKISVLEKERAETSARSPSGTVDERKFGYNPVYGELQILKIQIEAEILAAQGNIDAYRTNIERKKLSLSELSKLEQRHFQIQQDIASTQDLIKNLNTRLMEASIALESNISDFDILEYAQTPENPKRSYRKIITLGVALISMTIIGFFVLVREFLNNAVKTSFDLQDFKDVRFVAALPNKDQVSKATFYSQFHLFFSALMNDLTTRKTAIISVSSIMDGEGKSFICNEIIEQLENQGKRILYIESPASEYLPPEHACINQALITPAQTKDCCFQQVSEQFHKGYYVQNEKMYLDIIQESNIRDFANSLNNSYDVIIWETFEPNLHYQLYKTILKSSDFSLINARSGSTPKSELTRLINMLSDWRISNIGILLNALPNKYIR